MYDKSIVMNKAFNQIRTLALHSIINRVYCGALEGLFDKGSITDTHRKELSVFSLQTLEALGGYSLLENAIAKERDPQRLYLLRKINTICTEAAKTVAKRVGDNVDEKNHDKATKDSAGSKDTKKGELDKVAMNKEEYNEFIDKVKDLDTDEISKVIDEKVLTVIKDEKDVYVKEDNLKDKLKELAEESKKAKDSKKDSKDDKEVESEDDDMPSEDDIEYSNMDEELEKEDKDSKKKDKKKDKKDDEDEEEEGESEDEEDEDEKDSKKDKKKSKKKDDDDEEDDDEDDEEDKDSKKKDKKKSKKDDEEEDEEGEDESEDEEDEDEKDSKKKSKKKDKKKDDDEAMDSFLKIAFGKNTVTTHKSLFNTLQAFAYEGVLHTGNTSPIQTTLARRMITPFIGARVEDMTPEVTIESFSAFNNTIDVDLPEEEVMEAVTTNTLVAYVLLESLNTMNMCPIKAERLRSVLNDKITLINSVANCDYGAWMAAVRLVVGKAEHHLEKADKCKYESSQEEREKKCAKARFKLEMDLELLTQVRNLMSEKPNLADPELSRIVSTKIDAVNNALEHVDDPYQEPEKTDVSIEDRGTMNDVSEFNKVNTLLKTKPSVDTVEINTESFIDKDSKARVNTVDVKFFNRNHTQVGSSFMKLSLNQMDSTLESYLGEILKFSKLNANTNITINVKNGMNKFELR